jgi:ribosomal protein S17
LWCCRCRSFTYEEFITAQDKFQKAQAQQLAVRNEEVACAIEDVISLVEVRPLVTPQQWMTNVAQARAVR